MKKFLRLAAITAASVALVAGNATSANAAPGDGVAATIAIQPAATSGFPSTSTSYIPISVAATPGIALSSMKATVNLNGVPVANGVFVSPTNGFAYERTWGAGVVSLTNVIGAGTDTRDGTSRYFYDKPLSVAPNGAQIRYGLDYRSEIRVAKRGKKLTFKLKARYINNAGRAVSVGRATIQVKKGGKWKTLKHVKIKKNGTATYKRKDRKKRNYRMTVKTTSKIQGNSTGGTRKI